MLFEKKILEIGGTLYIPLPQDLAKYLSMEQGSEVILQDKEEGKKKILAVWKK